MVTSGETEQSTVVVVVCRSGSNFDCIGEAGPEQSLSRRSVFTRMTGFAALKIVRCAGSIVTAQQRTV